MSTISIDKSIVEMETYNQGRYAFGQYPCGGIYYAPKGRKPKVAFITSHYTPNWSQHYLAEYMARRGYGYLGWNTRFQGAPSPVGFSLDYALYDISLGVRWLQEVAQIDKIILLGNSGGASLMGAYQAQAVSPHLQPDALPSDIFDALPACDAYISMAAHPGRARILTEWLDPSVVDENDPLSCNPDLNMYNPDHSLPYDQAFVTRYRQAQIDRNERITRWAEEELARIRLGRPKGGVEISGEDAFGSVSSEGVFDRFFVVPRTFADLRFLDLTLDPSERAVGCYAGDPLQANYSGYGHPPLTSAREWLSMYSLSKTQISLEQQLSRIKQPAMVISFNRDQGCYPSHAQQAYDALGSDDKQKHVLDGDHYCAGEGADRDQLADLIAAWATDKVGAAL